MNVNDRKVDASLKCERSNAHFATQDLERCLQAELSALAERWGAPLRLELLGRLKPLDDSTTKFLIRANNGDPVAVIVCSRAIAPDLVARGARTADAIRILLGDKLGQPVIRPLTTGDVDGRSYVILPYCLEFSRWRLLRRVQRFRLHRPLLTWLADATAAAARNSDMDLARQSFHSVLRYLEQKPFLDPRLKQAVQNSMGRIDSGQWNPRHTFDHNDLWLGNVMLPSAAMKQESTNWPFVLIDWAGANAQGHGIVDLLRIARALKLSRAALRRELVAHSTALGCELQDTRGHLLANLGRLHLHLEHWPEENYLPFLHFCWKQLNDAIG